MVTFAVRWVRTASRGKVLGKSERQDPETWHDDIRCQPALSTQLLRDSVYCFCTRRKKLVTLMNPTFSGHSRIFPQSLSIISKNVKLQSTESVQPVHLHGGQVRLWGALAFLTCLTANLSCQSTVIHHDTADLWGSAVYKVSEAIVCVVLQRWLWSKPSGNSYV